MKNFLQVRQELKDIRYYYEKEELFIKGSKKICSSSLAKQVEKYSKAISKAPGKLYALYIAHYVNYKKQVAISIEWNRTTEYVKRLNKELCEYFQKVLD